jgi:hypothetical protein
MTKLVHSRLAQIPTARRATRIVPFDVSRWSTRGKTLSMANFVAYAEINLRAKSRRAS